MIDILMAVYNGERYIRQQLDSIINQSYKNWRLIIRDDGSTDATMSIIGEYEKKYSEKIIIIDDSEKTGGAKNNFFKLIMAAESDYMMLADQDDVWGYNKVMNAYVYIKKAERVIGCEKPILCYGDLQVVDSDLKLINASMAAMQKLDMRKRQFKDYLVQNNVSGCTTIFNKKLKQLCTEMPKAAIMHDWWLALIASAFGKVCFMREVEILYRQHGDNTEGVKNLKSIKYMIRKFFDRKNVKKTLGLTYEQAECFLEKYGEQLDNKNMEIINSYISLKDVCKLKKYCILRKYGFMKSGLARKIGYILFI